VTCGGDAALYQITLVSCQNVVYDMLDMTRRMFELVGAGLQSDDGVSLPGHVLLVDVGRMAHTADHDPGRRLCGVLVGARLQSDHALALLRHVVHPDVGGVAHPADHDAGRRLRRVLVGASLEPDHAMALLQSANQLRCCMVKFAVGDLR